MYTVDDQGNRVYTLKVSVLFHFLYPSFIARAFRNSQIWEKSQSRPTQVRRPASARRASRLISCLFIARFSPDDKFSRHRVTIKKRHGILLTQLPAKPM